MEFWNDVSITYWINVTQTPHLLLFLVVHFKMHESHAPHQPQTPHLYSGSGRERTLSEEPRIISRCALQDA
jgi:hypothetical protein